MSEILNFSNWLFSGDHRYSAFERYEIWNKFLEVSLSSAGDSSESSLLKGDDLSEICESLKCAIWDYIKSKPFDANMNKPTYQG
jgi:hypothetical protein